MRNRWPGAAIVAAMWAFTAAVYARLPHRIPTHWNLQGEVDGWMDKPMGALMLPLVATGLLGLLWLMPRIDPRRENLERFTGDRHLITNLLILFFAVIQGATFGAALGWPVQVDRVILAAVGLLFVGLGNYLPRIRSNWYMGIRTPWTLSSEGVWRATHRVGGRTFVVGGLVLAGAALLPDPLRAWITGGAIAVVLALPLVYSYVAYRRELSGRPL